MDNQELLRRREEASAPDVFCVDELAHGEFVMASAKVRALGAQILRSLVEPPEPPRDRSYFMGGFPQN